VEWFATWDVPQYKEWAKKADYGYLLAIMNEEKAIYRCARAKLIFQDHGLPEFHVLDEVLVKSREEAGKRIEIWKATD